MKPRLGSSLLVGLVLVVGCGSPDGGNPGDDVQLPDAGAACSDPRAALPDGWKPVAHVSSGAVTSGPGAAAGVTASTIDATAGGFGNSASEPFVYLKFGNGTLEKVAIDDTQSYTSTAWDVAFKRYVIRANGGDSGAGGVRVAGVDPASLADVSAAPPESAFREDDWTTDACAPILDTLGAPVTAVGTWYIANNMRLDPQPKVYVVRRADGTSFKLHVLTYYGDAADANKSAFFRVEWAPL